MAEGTLGLRLSTPLNNTSQDSNFPFLCMMAHLGHQRSILPTLMKYRIGHLVLIVCPLCTYKLQGVLTCYLTFMCLSTNVSSFASKFQHHLLAKLTKWDWYSSAVWTHMSVQ